MFVEKGWFLPTVQFGPDDVFFFEDWDETPVGPYRAIFHFTPEDYRVLYASTPEGRDLVSGIHRSDELYVVDIDSRRGDGRWTIEIDTGEKGILKMEIDYRETPLLKAINPVACRVPDALARRPLYCKLLPRLAGPILGIDPHQKIAAVTELGRKSRFRIEKIFKVTGANCTWGDREPGSLRDCRYDHDLGGFRLASRPMVSYLSLFVD